MGLDKTAKIYLAGHDGMVGSAIYRQLRRQGYDTIVARELSELDLTEQSAVREFFQSGIESRYHHQPAEI